jgi:FlaA1/EpsC-like NDP-sugar epimerase
VLDAGIWVVAMRVGAIAADDLGRDTIGPSAVASAAALLIAGQWIVGAAIGLYRGRWRVGSFGELGGLVCTVALVFAGFEIAYRAVGLDVAPPSGRMLAGFTAIALICVPRAMWRLLRDRQDRQCTAERILLYGAGQGCATILPVLLAPDSGFRPMALIDDDPAKRYRSLHGFRVLGDGEQLFTVATTNNATSVLIAMPGATSETVRVLVKRIEDCGLRALIMPRPAELIGATNDVREVSEADLLGRRVVSTDLDSIAEYLRGKRVLVTGAGGSIGSELARQLARFGPATLVILDRDESALHGTLLTMSGRAELSDEAAVLCDIRDAPAVERIFLQYRPQVVFHAAALKHVAMLERFPDEAYKTNVIGTLNVLRSAALVGVERFINISTDKAADPINVLGYSKRVTERLTATVGEPTGRPYVSVRFGNVLGSRGSMLITFRAQIQSGGPVTVTHPEATRYFMMIEEAVALTIQAGAIGNPGEVLVLDMGEPIRIKDVADLLIERSGRSIGLEYTGLQPGEKVHEVLFAAHERGAAGTHPAITHGRVPPLPTDLIDLLGTTGSTIGEAVARMRMLAAYSRPPQTPIALFYEPDDVVEIPASVDRAIGAPHVAI